jgi:hypothetical protein
MQSWSERAARRGGGVPPLRPPLPLIAADGWHLLADRRGGQRIMRWRPGVECWIDRTGRRVNAEDAPHEGLSYLEPTESPA